MQQLCVVSSVHKTIRNPSNRLRDKWLWPTVGWCRCSKCVQMHFWLTIFSAIGSVTATSFKSESVHVETILQHLLWTAFVTQAKKRFWNSATSQVRWPRFPHSTSKETRVGKAKQQSQVWELEKLRLKNGWAAEGKRCEEGRARTSKQVV